jgi:hypothetical protein
MTSFQKMERGESFLVGKKGRVLPGRLTWCGVACLVCVWAATAPAAPEAPNAPDVEIAIPAAAPADFSQVAGQKYDIAASAAPIEVLVEEPITLKVTIQGQGPAAYRPERKNLKIFPPDLADDFYLEPAADLDKTLPDKGVWEFVYRLRPKRADVTRIPGLHLCYFALREGGAGKFQNVYSDEIPIKVSPRPEATAEKLNLKVVAAPARFYQLRPVEDLQRDDAPTAVPGPGLLAVLLALPPAICLAWYGLWRRLYPDAAERRQRRRSRAARLALASLNKQGLDSADTRSAAVDFLRQRLDFPGVEASPAEVGRHLKRLGMAKPLIADWAAFLEACDRCRFAPAAAEPELLNVEAIRLIHAVEVDPCVGR